jgi:hypothetical protein
VGQSSVEQCSLRLAKLAPPQLAILSRQTKGVQRWLGQDIDLTARIPSDLIMAAAEVDPAISAAITPYVTMTGLPACLDPVEPLAHVVFATGWRPAASPGPTRSELAELIKTTPAEQI